MAFICAFLCTLCTHTLEAPSCSAAAVDDSRGAGASANPALHMGFRAADVAVGACRRPCIRLLRPLRALHLSSVNHWSYRTEKTISTV